MKEDVTKDAAKKPGRPKRTVDNGRPGVVGSPHQGANQMPVKDRRPRVPVQGADRLAISQRPGFVRRWVREYSNIEPTRSGRIQRFLDAGYVFVQEKGLNTGTARADDHTQMDSRVTKDGGGGTTLYAMEVPKEFYDEDQAAKMEQVDRLEKDIKRRLETDSGNAYGKVTISHGISRIPKGHGPG